RSAAGTDAGDALAVLQLGSLGQTAGDIVPVIGRDALQPADRDRLVLDATAPTGRLAGAITHASEDSRKHVGVTVHHVGVGEPSLGDQTDVFGDISVGRTCPLAIHDSMKVVGVRSIGGLHSVPLAVRAGPFVVQGTVSIARGKCHRGGTENAALQHLCLVGTGSRSVAAPGLAGRRLVSVPKGGYVPARAADPASAPLLTCLACRDLGLCGSLGVHPVRQAARLPSRSRLAIKVRNRAGFTGLCRMGSPLASASRRRSGAVSPVTSSAGISALNSPRSSSTTWMPFSSPRNR